MVGADFSLAPTASDLPEQPLPIIWVAVSEFLFQSGGICCRPRKDGKENNAEVGGGQQS